MKYINLIVLLPFFASIDCGKHQSKPKDTPVTDTTVSAKPIDSIPPCIQARIDSIRMQPKWNPPAQVDEYVYQDQHVFLFSADCCDQFDLLFDSNCKLLCAPSGGFTGKGDQKCTDFLKSATHVRLVWKDPR